MTPCLLWEVDSLPPQHTCPQIAAGGQSTRDQPSECLQPSRHYLMSLWDVPVKWCFLRLLLQEARVRLHDLQFHRQCEVIPNSVKPVWSSILLSLPSPDRGEASGRRERAGYFFFSFLIFGRVPHPAPGWGTHSVLQPLCEPWTLGGPHVAFSAKAALTLTGGCASRAWGFLEGSFTFLTGCVENILLLYVNLIPCVKYRAGSLGILVLNYLWCSLAWFL